MSEKVIKGLVGAILKYDQMILDYDYIAKNNTSAQVMADIDLASIDVDEDLESDGSQSQSLLSGPIITFPTTPTTASGSELGEVNIEDNDVEVPLDLPAKRKQRFDLDLECLPEPEEIEQFVQNSNNVNTLKRTQSVMKLFLQFVTAKGESRPVEEIPTTELDLTLGQFFTS